MSTDFITIYHPIDEETCGPVKRIRVRKQSQDNLLRTSSSTPGIRKSAFGFVFTQPHNPKNEEISAEIQKRYQNK